MLVKDVMSTMIETIAPSSNVRECARKMDQVGVGLLPVSENGKLVGVVTDRDICCNVVATERREREGLLQLASPAGAECHG